MAEHNLFLSHYNDQICIECGNWYVPDNPIEDDGRCQHCKRTRKVKKYESNTLYQNLMALWTAITNIYQDETDSTELTYFIRGKQTRRIKVGYTTVDAYKRMMELQTGSPDQLELLGVIRAPYSFEQSLHSVLHQYRSHGEWFESNQGLIRFIKRVAFLPAHPKFGRRAFEINQYADDAIPSNSEITPQGQNIAAIDEKHLKSPHTRFVIFPVRPYWLLDGTLAWLDALEKVT